MTRKRGPTWDQLTEEQKIRFDQLFTLIRSIKARRAAGQERQ